VLFNNAGISPPDDDSILTTGLDAWRRVQEVNLTSVYLCCKLRHPPHAAPRRRGDHQHRLVRGRAGLGHLADLLHRVQGRRALHVRELGVQFAREGIRVNALCPGPVNTPLLQELFAKDPERAARRLVHVPMGRFAEAEEIASAVLFLASDDSSFITASTFLVDGGIHGAYVTPL
jgi:NAD(P)-dependent dehydrogenase (short-subunit alcohol dehydrogenase family)